ncbi:hypothetical protein GQ55_2G114000 [Panicum hallii var. hallii]|uniref:Uncharacterized protein n=1 Tax=Panicum hallii var. hallii TaxID=1504633 RepID=A0A2T7ENU9_9POAL|nr:hypothetical protein GQ55_2G114000 [Panicum hallii var. hallii]
MYFRLLHNQGGRLYIVRTIGQVLCVLLFMNGFMPSVLIAILIFLGSSANLGYRKSMFRHCVASAGCLINPSTLCFSLCHRNNSDSFLFANQRTNRGTIGKYQNTFLGPPFVLLQSSSPPSFLRLNRSSPQTGHFSRY